jgi:hypothetical protein
MSVRSMLAGGCVAWCLGLTASQAWAQGSSERKWEVDVHAGFAFAGNPTDGTPIAQFPAGAPLSTGFLATTRAVSSWYFGDGATLLNQVNAGFNVPSRLTPLDTSLTRAAVRRTDATGFGVRLGRGLTPRLVAEFSLDYGLNTLHFNDETRTTIEAARASFVTAWNALLGTGAVTDRTVTSTADVVEGKDRQVSLTGAVKFRLKPEGRITPYITAGAGAVLQSGDAPSATLTGDYNFRFAGLFPITERDSVTVRVVPKDRVFLGVFGGGIEYDIPQGGGRHGIRADVRVHMSPNRLDTVVSATPSVTLQSPAFAVSTGGLTSVQFSNTNDPRFGRQSSLSGPAVTDLRTFTGSGMQTQVLVGVGYVLRF